MGLLRWFKKTGAKALVDVDEDNPLPVSIAGGFSGTITAGTEYTEGDVDASIAGQAMLWEDAGDTLRVPSAAKPLPVNVVSGVSSTEYTEGNTDATITGQAILWEDTGDTLRPVSAAKPMPVNVVSGAFNGAVTVADGANAALGTTTDGIASSDLSLPATAISVLKRIGTQLVGTLATAVADGANVAVGATTDPANTTGNAGTLMGYIRGALQAMLAWSDTGNGWVNVSLASLISALQDGISTYRYSGYVTVPSGDAQNPFLEAQVKRKVVRITASGDTQLIAAVLTKKFRVLKWRVQTEGVVDVSFKTTADGTLLKVIGAGSGGGGGEGFCEHGHFETSTVNQDLTANLSAAVGANIQILYIEV